MAADPFPLFHLSPLDFAVSNPAQLSSAQLALAPYSAEWDEAAEKKVIRTWRQRREKNRARMGTVGIGVYASPEERAREQWPLFELVDLAWELKGAELESLTSAQLAVVAFHPDSTKDLVADAEDIWFARRERDFSLGLSLPPFPPQETAATSTAASIPVPVSKPAASAAPKPTHVPAVAPPAASAPHSNGSSSQAWLDADVDVKPKINPGAVVPPKRLTMDDYRRGKETEAREVAQKADDERRRKEAEARKQREDDESRRETDKRKESARVAAAEQLATDERARRAKTPVYERDERDRTRDREGRRDRDDYRDRDRLDDRDRERVRERDSSERKRDRPVDLDERSPTRRRRSSVTSTSREGRPSDRPSSRDRDLPLRAQSRTRRDYGFVPSDEGRVSRFADRNVHTDDEISPDLHEALKVLHITNMPRRAAVEQIRSMLLSTHQIATVGIKVAPNAHSSDKNHVAVAYLLVEDARLVVDRLGGHVFLGEALAAEMARSPAPGPPGWRWYMIDNYFREDWKAGRIRLPRPQGGDDRPTTYPTRTKAPLPPQMLPSEHRRTSTSTGTTNGTGGSADDDFIPFALSSGLSQIFMSNCPEFVTVDETREYLKGLAGLVGIALGSSNIRWHNSSLWVAFATKEDRDKALHRLHGAVFLRMDVALYLEEGERGKGKKEWRWLEMSRDFRDKHRPTPQRASSPKPTASPRPSSSTVERKPSIPAEPRRSEFSSSRTPSISSAMPPRASLSATTTRPSESESSEHPAKRIKTSTSSDSAVNVPLPSPALSDRLRPAPAQASQPPTPAGARPPSLPSKPMFSLADDEGYTPANAGGLGLSLRLSMPAGKVRPSQQPLIPDTPADLSETLAALVPFTPAKTSAPSLPPSSASTSQPPSGPRNRSVYDRPSAASLSSIPGVAPDDTNQVRDWTTWAPAAELPMFTTAKGTYVGPSVPRAPLSPKSKPAASRLPGTTPTGPKNLSIAIKGGPGTKSPKILDTAPAARFNEGINGSGGQLSAKEAERARDQARLVKAKSADFDVVMLD